VMDPASGMPTVQEAMFYVVAKVLGDVKPSLIDSEAANANEAEGASHGERLSERAPQLVMQQSELTGTTTNREKSAEMPDYKRQPDYSDRRCFVNNPGAKLREQSGGPGRNCGGQDPAVQLKLAA